MNAIILSCSSGVVILTVPKMCIRDRIKDAFKNGKAFIPFVTAGDPDLETTDVYKRQDKLFVTRNGL